MGNAWEFLKFACARMKLLIYMVKTEAACLQASCRIPQ